MRSAIVRSLPVLLFLVAACSSKAGGGGGESEPADSGPAAGADAGRDAATPGAPSVAISEIMYNPVLEDTEDESHEFVELYNTTGAAVSLAGWKLTSAKGLV